MQHILTSNPKPKVKMPRMLRISQLTLTFICPVPQPHKRVCITMAVNCLLLT